MRSTEPGCFRSRSWSLWKALEEERSIGLVSWHLKSSRGGVHWLGFMAVEKLLRRGAAWFHGVWKALEEGCITLVSWRLDL
jgi:hypothetical protein